MDDTYAIRLAKTELREGYNTGDVNRVLSVYADAYVDMSAGCASFYGTEASAVLKHRLTTLFGSYRAELVVTIYSIRVEGPIALDRGCHRLTLTPKKGGRSRTIRTRYLDIWQKGSDEQWRIAVFIDNQDVAPVMPPREVLKAMAGVSSRRRRAANATR